MATSPAAPPSRSCVGSTPLPATTCSVPSPARSIAPTTGSRPWSRRTRRSRAPAARSRPRSSTAPRSAWATSATAVATCLRDGAISQLTADHTFVQSLIDEGRITEDEARVHPHRNLILRAVDGVHEPEPDVFTLELALGDRILLCSDGCSGVLDDDNLARLLGEGTPDHAAVSLISASLDAGSSDNITVVVADLVDDDAVDEAETSAAAVVGPLLVGAAAEAPRGRGSAPAGRPAPETPVSSTPVSEHDDRGRRRPRGDALRAPAAAQVHLGAPASPSWRCSRSWSRSSRSRDTGGARASSTSPTTAARWPSSVASRPTSPASRCTTWRKAAT